jgi:HK97 family phage portal protein
LSNAISTLPFVLYEEAANGGKTKIRNHWLYRIFARRPNDFQNPAEFRSMMQGHLSLRGNAFARIFANGKGEVTDLIPIHPDRVTVEPLSDINWRYRIKNQDGSSTPIQRRDMFHLKGLSGDGIMGYSPIQLARNAISGAIAAQDYGTRYFKNDAAPTGGWIEHPSSFKDQEAKRLFRESWQEQQSGKNKGKMAVLEYGLKYHPGVAISNGDAQFIEARKYSVSDIARLFGVRPHKIGDLEKATFSNIEQQSIDSVNDDLIPWIVCWEEAIRYNFLDPEDDTLQVEFPITSLLRGDSAARSQYYNKGIMGGWLTRNEARIAESYNPLPGLDEPLRPLNMIGDSASQEEDDEIKNGEALPANANPNEPPDDSAPSKSMLSSPISSSQDARLMALGLAAAERIARKELAMVERAAIRDDRETSINAAYRDHATFVSNAMGIGLPTASAYCDEQAAIAVANPGMHIENFIEIARCKLERLAIKGSL